MAARVLMSTPVHFKASQPDYENLQPQRRKVAQSKDMIIHYLLSKVYLKNKIFSDFIFFSRDAYEHDFEKIIEIESRNISVVTIDASLDNKSEDSFSVEISVTTARHISKRASDQNYLKLFFKKDSGSFYIDKKTISFSGGDGDVYCLEPSKVNGDKMSISETITHKKMCLSFIDIALHEVDKEEFTPLVCNMVSAIKGKS